MWSLLYFSTGDWGWHTARNSSNPRDIRDAFDEIARGVKVPVIELALDGEIVLRIGLDMKALMRVAVLGCRPSSKKSFVKLRARGVKDVKAGRALLLDAMVR